MKLDISYRGRLRSCNYACDYCPMAMQTDSKEEKKKDKESLNEFVRWIAKNPEQQFRILITPWGEALVRRWYRDAVIELSNMKHVHRITVQTNLSRSPSWLLEANAKKVSLWVTYHPEQVSKSNFLKNIEELNMIQAEYTVGMVGKQEYAQEIQSMRTLISNERYFWINAYESGKHQYPDDVLNQFTEIDPLFLVNYKQNVSLDKSCSAGKTSLFIDGYGSIRRCHFVNKVIGSIRDSNWQSALQTRPCPNTQCNCYIGYIHLEAINVEKYYGAEKLTRTPLKYQKKK